MSDETPLKEVVVVHPIESRHHDRLLLTVDDAARRLGVSRRSLYRMLERGDIGSVRIGRCRRIVTAHLDALAADRDQRRERGGVAFRGVR